MSVKPPLRLLLWPLRTMMMLLMLLSISGEVRLGCLLVRVGPNRCRRWRHDLRHRAAKNLAIRWPILRCWCRCDRMRRTCWLLFVGWWRSHQMPARCLLMLLCVLVADMWLDRIDVEQLARAEQFIPGFFKRWAAFITADVAALAVDTL